VPAHFSGICGLKPTPGRIPATGHFPVSVGPFALLGVVGPMARTAADLKVLFEVMQGPDDGDPSAAPVPVRWPTKEDLKKLRVGYFEDDGRTPVTPETRAAVRTAAQALEGAGFQVAPFRPEGLEASRQLWWKLFGVAGGMLLGPMTRLHEAELSPILKEFSGWVAAEKPHTAQTLLDAWIERDMVRMQVFQQMQEFPILLCPVAAVPAFRHGERSWPIDGQMVKYLDAWSYTEWFNLLGMPGAAVPMGKSAEGLPIGVQVVGLPWQEEVVLGVAAELEEQRGEWQGPST
jgi:Asp-tRNA(Asn)/Glu-tRNA(Gln) amidotransferase A subunit family amidase